MAAVARMRTGAALWRAQSRLGPDRLVHVRPYYRVFGEGRVNPQRGGRLDLVETHRSGKVWRRRAVVPTSRIVGTINLSFSIT